MTRPRRPEPLGSAGSIAAAIADRVARQGVDGPTRRLIALAGPPASGKTSVAAALRHELTDRGLPCGLVAMDGFHMANSVLDARGLRARKGAPETFDLQGFASLLDRLKSEDEVMAPVFDRTLDAAICAAEVIRLQDRCVVVEGNYLLLDAPGWRDLARHWDVSVFLAQDEAVLEHRLMDRWLNHGFTIDDAQRKVHTNDLANARHVLRHRLPSDVVIGPNPG